MRKRYKRMYSRKLRSRREDVREEEKERRGLFGEEKSK
jgi:hypothetical protein